VLAVADAADGARSLDEALRQVCRALAALTGAETVAAHVVDRSSGILRPIAGYHVPPHVLGALRAAELPLGEQGFWGRVSGERRVVWSDDVPNDPRFAFQLFRDFPHQSGAVVPLVLDGEVAGAFYLVWWRRRRRLGRDEVATLQGVGRQAGVRLQSARLLETLQERTARLRTLARLNRLVSSSLDTREVPLEIARAAAEMIGAQLVSLWMADGATRLLELAAFSDPAVETDFPCPVLRYCEGGVGSVARHERPVRVPDVFAADSPIVEREWWQRQGLRSFLGVPVMLDGVLLAVLGLHGRGPLDLDAEGDLLESFAAQAAVAIRNARRYQSELGYASKIVDSVPCGLLIVSTDLRAVSANRALEALCGLGDGESRGRKLEDLLPVPELVARVAEVMFTGRAIRNLFVEFVPAAGRRLLRVAVTRVRAGEGEEPCALLVIDDHTEIERAGHALRERDAQLRQAQKLEAVGRLAAGVAHDFNNLLTVVQGRTQLLEYLLPAGSALRSHAEVIEEAVARGVTLTRQLLAFSRKQELQPRVLDVNAVIGEFRKILGRLLGEDVELIVELAPDLGRVVADPGQLEQVILNLAVNARDAMPDGGRLTIATAEVEVDAATAANRTDARPGPHVRLTVTDIGCGMEPETLARIFEPFFTTKEPGKGTGLGLATVYGIVRQSGGFVSVESAPGSGTTFHVYLPRTLVEATPVVAITAEAAPPAGRETVLLAEDDEALRGLIREVLQVLGYTVLEAADGETALALASTHPGRIDLLLTDMVMPRLGGRELGHRLLAGRPALRVLYMSGYPSDVPVLTKPFTPDGLARAVRAALDGPDSLK
jgi:PAS domain S-box-containing protein